MRFPDIINDVTIFVYVGDIWKANAKAGEGIILTSQKGLELY